MLTQLQGHVLEVAAGTGSNLRHYQPKHVDSLTLLDNSAAMLREAAHKARELKVAFAGTQPSGAFDPRYVGTSHDAMCLVCPHRNSPDEPQGGILYVVHDGQRITSSCQASSCHSTLMSLTRAARRQAATDAAMRDAFAARQGGSMPSALEAAVESFTSVNKPTVEALRNSGAEMRRQRVAASAFARQFYQQRCADEGAPEHACCVAPHAFDTVVDTFGLCTVEDPVAMVNVR